VYIVSLLDISPVWPASNKNLHTTSSTTNLLFYIAPKNIHVKNVMYFLNSCFHTFKSGSFINALSLHLVGLQVQHVCFIYDREIVQK